MKMKKSMILTAVLLGLTTSSIASAGLKPAAKVSKISFMMKHRSSEQHKDRLSHGRK
jgi:hypothetical protein